MLSKELIKVIKEHPAYVLNVAHEKDAEATIIFQNALENPSIEHARFEVDPWRTEEAPVSNLTIGKALNLIYDLDFYWYLKGL